MDQTTVQKISVFITFIAMLMSLVPQSHAASVVNSISYRALQPGFSLEIFPLDDSKANLEMKVELDGADLLYYGPRRHRRKPS